MTDLESEKQIVTLARNLSLFGCFVATALLSSRERRSDCESHTGVRHSQPLVGWPMPQRQREWGLRLAKLQLETERSSTSGWVRSNLPKGRCDHGSPLAQVHYC